MAACTSRRVGLPPRPKPFEIQHMLDQVAPKRKAPSPEADHRVGIHRVLQTKTAAACSLSRLRKQVTNYTPRIKNSSCLRHHRSRHLGARCSAPKRSSSGKPHGWQVRKQRSDRGRPVPSTRKYTHAPPTLAPRTPGAWDPGLHFLSPTVRTWGPPPPPPRAQEALWSPRKLPQAPDARDLGPLPGQPQDPPGSPRPRPTSTLPPTASAHPRGGGIRPAHVCGLLSSSGRAAAAVSAQQPLLIAGEGLSERAEPRGTENALGGCAACLGKEAAAGAQLDLECSAKGWEVLPSCVAGVSSPRRGSAGQSQGLSAGPCPDPRENKPARTSRRYPPRPDFARFASVFPARPARPKAAAHPPLLGPPRLRSSSNSGAQGRASGPSWARGQRRIDKRRGSRQPRHRSLWATCRRTFPNSFQGENQVHRAPSPGSDPGRLLLWTRRSKGYSPVATAGTSEVEPQPGLPASPTHLASSCQLARSEVQAEGDGGDLTEAAGQAVLPGSAGGGGRGGREGARVQGARAAGGLARWLPPPPPPPPPQPPRTPGEAELARPASPGPLWQPPGVRGKSRGPAEPPRPAVPHPGAGGVARHGAGAAPVGLLPPRQPTAPRRNTESASCRPREGEGGEGETRAVGRPRQPGSRASAMEPPAGRRRPRNPARPRTRPRARERGPRRARPRPPAAGEPALPLAAARSPAHSTSSAGSRSGRSRLLRAVMSADSPHARGGAGACRGLGGATHRAERSAAGRASRRGVPPPRAAAHPTPPAGPRARLAARP
ncbi:collagen alpha-1(III) chain-like [Panthera leo]|uniref:collagen alpha-1(III) chain-like n=1 Tax=Panthera leo TaxID=9689 RepID=UPI001C69D433|nr:collagen alpha-1(III) chain-like [Panthera leo]